MNQDRPERIRVVICGAAGRDYHTFNRVYRDDPTFEVIAFTATQIPGIADRQYPVSLAGRHYPSGIPIVSEAKLSMLIQTQSVQRVVFAYSDVSFDHVMSLASQVMALGVEWVIHGTEQTMIRSMRPVIAVSAVRTGCGKSQVARYLSQQLRSEGSAVAVLRHPMPYGDLARQSVQRFAHLADLEDASCTLEEREEYEPHLAAGNLVFAGVDYQAIVAAADAESDVLMWDGGNNDFPFLKPDVHIVVTDALRPGHLTGFFPGEAVLQMADIVVINKVNSAPKEAVDQMRAQLQRLRPSAPIVLADSVLRLSKRPKKGTKVLVVDDGPTLTHGGMPFGAAFQAIAGLGLEVIDPRRSATPDLLALYEQYPHLSKVLPAVGYSPEQREALRRTIEASDADVVISGTPIDLAADLAVTKPVIRVHYDYQDHASQAPGQHGLLGTVTQRLSAIPLRDSAQQQG